MALLDEGPAIHDWHHQVEDDDVRTEHSQAVEALGAVGRFANQIALAGEQIVQESANARLIVYYQDAPGRAGVRANALSRRTRNLVHVEAHRASSLDPT